jgi:bzd-type benzoyl-CoA reductase N subunit
MQGKMILDEFKETAGDSLKYLRNWKSRSGKKILGYFCTNTPEEIIHAAGFLPVRILSSPTTISLAAKHLQSYSCSLVQSSLEAALRGDLNFLDGTVFPHTCDSIQRLSDIWWENLRFSFHWDVVLPVKLHTDSARTYMIQELNRFRKGLGEFTGHPITDGDLKRSISLFNQNRSLLRQLYRRRMENPEKISPGANLAIIQSATFMPKEEFNPKLQNFLDSQVSLDQSSNHKLRLFISGSVCNHSQIFALFDHLNAHVVGDDLCTGWRYFSEDASLDGDPIAALADRLIRRVPCPCKHNPRVDRSEDLIQRVEEARAQGVIFLLLKFCDPHAFDYPYLKEKLSAKRISSLLMEIEPGSMPLGAVETRLQAFIETLGG